MSEAKRKSEFGIWKKTVRLKSGDTSEVLSFSVNGTRYNAWPNKYKQNEKSPDYNVYVDDYVKPAQTTSTPVVKEKEISANDLPF